MGSQLADPPWTIGLTIGLWLIAMLALARAYRPLRGTTLRAAWWWAMAAVSAVAGAEVAIAVAQGGGANWAEPLRFAAVAATFCPLVALFGARRPQDQAWQWIVLSFWVVLALPAGQAWLMWPGQPLTVHAVWSWFLVVLIVAEASNYLPTRFGPAAILLAAGQTALLWRDLPWAADSSPGRWLSLAGFALIAAAAAIAAISGHRRRAIAPEPLDRVWRDFRDQFGVVWGLRIAERINATAAVRDWPIRLGWHGFTDKQETGTRLVLPAARARSAEKESRPLFLELEQALRTLLRRFVSSEWLDRRMTESPPR